MVAIAAITPSAVRRAGSSGVAAAARDYLASLRLQRFAVSSPAQFAAALNRSTSKLEQALPTAGRSWGVARKCLNLFLRDSLYNWYLRTNFRLDVAEPLYEVPLDSLVATRLRRLSSGHELPPWRGVKHLTPPINDIYQKAAAALAQKRGVQRVHLDLYLGPWVQP
jgi:hypothetical protein